MNGKEQHDKQLLNRLQTERRGPVGDSLDTRGCVGERERERGRERERKREREREREKDSLEDGQGKRKQPCLFNLPTTHLYSPLLLYYYISHT